MKLLFVIPARFERATHSLEVVTDTFLFIFIIFLIYSKYLYFNDKYTF
jgi:hypothetical protein